MSSSHATIAPPSPAATVVVGTGPSRSPTSSRSPGTARPSSCPREALAEVAPHPRRHRGAGRRRASRTTASPPASARWPPGTSPPTLRAQLQRSLVRSHAAGSGPEVEREVVRALMLLRLSTLATGRTGVREQTAHDLRRAAQRRHHPGRPRVRLARLLRRPRAARALRARADGRGRRCATPTARCAPRRDALAAAGITPVVLRREGGPGPHQRHRRHARHARARHRTTCALLLTHRRRRRRDERRGAARHRRRVRRRPAGAAAAPRPGGVARRTCARCWPDQRDRGEPPRPRTAPACRTPTRCAARRRSPARARDTVEHAATVAGRELAAAIDNPVVTPRRPGRVQRQLPRRAGRPTCSTSSRSSPPTWPRCPSGAPTGSSTSSRSHGLPPFLADDPGVDSGHMIAQYTQAAIVSELKRLAVPASVDSIPSARRCRRTTSRWAGPAARKLRRAVDGLTRVLAVEVLTAARGLDLRAPLAPAPATGAVVQALRRRRSPGPAPTATSRPRSRRPSSFVAAGAARRRRRVRHRPARAEPPRQPTTRPSNHPHSSNGDRHGRRPPRPRPARHHPDRAVVADRGPAADADEQPRPRGRRAARRPRRLRRHRQGGPRLGSRSTPSCAR